MNATGVAIIPAGPKASEPNRWHRLAADTDPRLRGWLHRTARMHAMLTRCVRLYANPSTAGGASNEGESFAARAAAGDPSILHDALGNVVADATELRDEVGRVMDDVPATPHAPGTPGKLDALAARYAAGVSLFAPGDAATDLE